MWAKYMSEDYVIEAPESYAGILGFNQKPEMMKQFGFKEVKDADNFDKSKQIRYKLFDNYILRYNQEPDIESQKEKVMALRNLFLQAFSGTRKNTDVSDKSDSGAFVSLENEEKALKSYKEYLENIENEPDFPNIKVLGFGDWLNSGGIDDSL